MSDLKKSKRDKSPKRKPKSKSFAISDPVGSARPQGPVAVTHGSPHPGRKPLLHQGSNSTVAASPAVPARPSSAALNRLAASSPVPLEEATPKVPSRPSAKTKERLKKTLEAEASSPSPKKLRRSGEAKKAADLERKRSGDVERKRRASKSPRPIVDSAPAALGDATDEEDSSPGKGSRLRALSSSSMLLSRQAIQKAAEGEEAGDEPLGTVVRSTVKDGLTPSEEAERKKKKKEEMLADICDAPVKTADEDGMFSTSGLQWKRSPDAEKIMALLQMEAAREKPDVATIEIDRRLIEQEEAREKKEAEAIAAASAISVQAGEEEKKKVKKMRRRTKTDMFVITRDDTGVGAGLVKLETELKLNTGDAPPKQLSEEEARAAKRFKIATEIRMSEEAYVKGLQCLVHKYMRPLVKQAASNEFPGVDPRTVKEIFSNVTLIQNVNGQLTKDINARLAQWTEATTMGDVFMDVAPYFKMYNQYGNNYQNSIESLNECMKVPAFAAAIVKCDESHTFGAKIESLLISPIQRIPRYLLLLRGSTPKEHEDYNLLGSALPLMQGIADYINSNIKQAEQMKKFMQISSGGAKALMQAHRTLRYEGTVMDHKSKKTTYKLYIFSDIIIIISESKAKNKELLALPHFQWPLHLVWYTYYADSFRLQGPDNCYHVKGMSADETTNWQKQICTAQAQHLQYLTDTKDPNLQQERQSRMSVSDAVRYGSFQFETGAIYEGFWRDGKMEGDGGHQYLKNHFRGTFHNGLKTGHGRMHYMTGDVFDGDWLHDRPNGRGSLQFANGDVYTGNFANGLKTGEGVMTCQIGDKYEGMWANDVPEGTGTMTYHNGSTYVGSWKGGKRHHFGLLRVPSAGQSYEGSWADGMREGRGVMTWNDGSQYDGQWKQNLRSGKGIYKSSSVGLYNGEWVNDCKEGSGTQEYLNGNVYIGSWKRGMYHGSGKLTYSSGTVRFYDGEWVYNKRHGKGVMAFFNGDKYEGQFKENMLHGAGEYRFKSGITIEAKWVRGKAEGKATVRLSDHPKDFVSGTVKDNYITEKGMPSLQLPVVPPLEFDCW